MVHVRFSFRRSFPLLVVAASFMIGGCAATGGPRSAPTEAAQRPGGLSDAEIEAIYEARIAASREQFVEADVRFMTAMIHHHAQAVEISEMAPGRSSDPSIRTLAARIINAQLDEITTMERWLADRDRAVPDRGHHHASHAHPMPGMLTPAQVEALSATTGREFDRLFLALMIEHHQGAVEMVRNLFATHGAGRDEEVFRFASDVQVDQITEIARMERMLAALAGGTDPR